MKPFVSNIKHQTFPPAAFAVVLYFPASFPPLITTVIVLPFVTSTLTSCLSLHLPPVACTSFSRVPLSLSRSLLSLSPLSPSCMFTVILSPFVFLVITLPPLNLLSSSFLSLHCSFRPIFSPFHRSLFHPSLGSFSSPPLHNIR